MPYKHYPFMPKVHEKKRDKYFIYQDMEVMLQRIRQENDIIEEAQENKEKHEERLQELIKELEG